MRDVKKSLIVTAPFKTLDQRPKDRLRFVVQPKLYERDVLRCEVHLLSKPQQQSGYAVFPSTFAGCRVLFF